VASIRTNQVQSLAVALRYVNVAQVFAFEPESSPLYRFKRLLLAFLRSSTRQRRTRHRLALTFRMDRQTANENLMAANEWKGLPVPN